MKKLTVALLIALGVTNLHPADGPQPDGANLRDLPTLIILLKDPSSKVRASAAAELGELGDARAAEPLIAAVRDQNQDWDVRTAASRALAKLHNLPVEPLIAWIKDRDLNVRTAAAAALVKLGKPALEPLIACLKDGNANIRSSAAFALGQMVDAKSLDPLITCLTDTDLGVRQTAASGLAGLGKAAVGPLILLLKNQNRWVRASVIAILGKLSDARSVEPLIVCLKDEAVDVRTSAATELGKLGDRRAVEPLIASLKDKEGLMRIIAAATLGGLGDVRAVDPLLDCLQDHEGKVRAAAATSLGKLGGARIVGPLIECLKDKDGDVRISAIDALGKPIDARAKEPLIGSLKDKEGGVRASAIRALGKMGDARVVEPLIACLNDAVEDICFSAVASIVRLGKPAIEPLIVSLLSEDGGVRFLSADALGKLGDTRAVVPLIASLKDSRTYVRSGAAAALVRLGKPCLEPLIACLKDPDKDVRAYASVALGHLEDARAVEPLTACLKDQADEVRFVAALALRDLGVSVAADLHAGDWPQWCGANSRNMVSSQFGLPVDISPGKKRKGTEEIDIATTMNCLWVAKLGSQTNFPPAIANGQVFIGTNNESPRNPLVIGDRGILMAFEEKTGKFQWQLVAPKLECGKISDWEYLGICSTPTIVGDRGYVITNRCEVVCFSTKGLAAGNAGMQEEAAYMTAPGKDGKLHPGTPGPQDADIIWVFDMRRELGVFPHNITACCPLVVNGKVYTNTSNGVDWSHTNIPAPDAPSLACVDAETGKYVAEIPLAAKVSAHTFHCNWCSPSYAKINGQSMIFFGGGDGFLYGMGLADERQPLEKEKDIYELPVKLKYDAAPKEYRFKPDGSPRKYAEWDGPSEVIATPVIVDGRCYVAIGQDPEHGEGKGMLSCIDVTQSGDLSGKALWTFKALERSMSTPAVKDGLVYEADYTGRLFCLDARTGQQYWMFDTKGHIWSSPLVADGKIYLGNEEGDFYILAEGKESKVLGHIDFDSPIKVSAVAANGVLYVQTETNLYAFKEGAKPLP